MATLYQNKGHWLLTVQYQGRRLTRSLRTKDKRVAKQLKPYIESQLILELTGLKKRTSVITFPDLAAKFLKANTKRSKNTQKLYKYVLRSYINDKPLPTNPNSRAIFIRTINACWNWGLKQGLIDKANKLEGDTKGEPRQRVYTEHELDLLFNQITDEDFNAFVHFAYYTGARSGEIRRISSQNVFFDYMFVDGKSGHRIVKLNSQARGILDNNSLWNYTINYVPLTWRRNLKRLGIANARFHDLRRTFGYNLIKQGRPIYEVSKLLGHSSVTTTERHYAPLMVTEIDTFIL